MAPLLLAYFIALIRFIEFPEAGFKELDVITKKIKKLGGGLLLIDYGYTNPQNKDTLQSVMKQKKKLTGKKEKVN